MRRILPICVLVLLAGCHKTLTPANAPVETADQKLVKIIKTVTMANNSVEPLYSDTAYFNYDAMGKVVAEGSTFYTRDAGGRIMQVKFELNEGKKDWIYQQVHYTDDKNERVAYTVDSYQFTSLEKLYTIRDSAVYLHENDKLVKITKYVSENGDPFYLDRYFNMKYDVAGNMAEMRSLVVRPNRPDIVCQYYNFKSYDDKVNPIPQGDEARSLFFLWGTDNTFKNNIVTEEYVAGAGFDVIKNYDYRADGRPRSATITTNGNTALIYHYYYE